jgi:hypothetical protein
VGLNLTRVCAKSSLLFLNNLPDDKNDKEIGKRNDYVETEVGEKQSVVTRFSWRCEFVFEMYFSD